MQYNLSELEHIFYKLENILNNIEEIKLNEKTFLLFLANDDKVKVKINFLNVAHLLGINTEQLKLSGFYTGNNSYEILRDFVSQGAYQFHKLNKEGILSCNNVFSAYLKSKMDGFLENMKFSVNDISFVCKYNSERGYTSSTKNQKYDYIIVKKLFADRYGAICLVKNTFDYAPMSNQIFETQEELSQFLKDNISNQEVTILNAMNFKRNDVSQDTMIKLPLPLFAKKLKELKKVKQDFSCIVDTSNALIYHLNKYIESINALNNETRTVDKVCSNMSKGKLLDSSDIKSSNIKRIIDSFNEFLCNKDNINTENNTEHYQQVKDELKEKKERIIELEKEIQELKEQNNKYKDENCSINDLLLCFDDVRNEVIELLKKPKIK